MTADTTNSTPQAMSSESAVPDSTISNATIPEQQQEIVNWQMLEHQVLASYVPPGVHSSPNVEWVRNPIDGSILRDHKNYPVSVNRILATKPLRSELSSRPGPGGKRLTYLSGEGVTRTLNEIFGFDGWDLQIIKTTREECRRDEKGRFNVAYTAQVRLIHKKSGTYKEDVGASDSCDRQMGTAISHALKGSITDALKRAARHFGEKLGNTLYSGTFTINKAPVTLRDALDQYDKERADSKFGSAIKKRLVEVTTGQTQCDDGNNTSSDRYLDHTKPASAGNTIVATTTSHHFHPTSEQKLIQPASPTATSSNNRGQQSHVSTVTQTTSSNKQQQYQQLLVASMPSSESSNTINIDQHRAPKHASDNPQQTPVAFKPSTFSNTTTLSKSVRMIQPPLSASDRLAKSSMFAQNNQETANANKENEYTENDTRQQLLTSANGKPPIVRPGTANGRRHSNQQQHSDSLTVEWSRLGVSAPSGAGLKRPLSATTQQGLTDASSSIPAKKMNANPYNNSCK